MFLVELLGEDRAQNVLRNYIKSNIGLTKAAKKHFNISTDSTEPVAKKKSNKGVRKGTKMLPWSAEEKQYVDERAVVLYGNYKNWHKVAVTLAMETGRTESAIYQHIYKAGVIAKFTSKQTETNV